MVKCERLRNNEEAIPERGCRSRTRVSALVPVRLASASQSHKRIEPEDARCGRSTYQMRRASGRSGSRAVNHVCGRRRRWRGFRSRTMRQPVMRLAKLFELGAVCSSCCEESFQ